MKIKIFLLTIFFLGFISLQSAAQWQLSLDSCSSWSIAKKDTSALAGTTNGIYFSDISGMTWTFKICPASYVRSIIVKDSIIFITSDFDGVFKSLDNGLTWISINSGISNPAQVWSITRNDSLLLLGTSSSFAGDTASLYISSDDGAIWKKVFSLGTTEVFYSFAVSENEVFVGVLPSGLFYSDDKGLTWTLRNAGIAAKHIALSEPNLLCGITGGGGGTYLSNDKGITWTNVLSIQHGYCFATFDNYTFTGNTNGFYYSTDNGYTWINDNIGLPPNADIISICVVDSIIYIATTNAEIYIRSTSDITTGTNDGMKANTEFFVYPNPVTNAVNIQNNTSQNIKFTLYNSLGEIILNEIITHKTGAIDMSAYSNDLYFYHASINNRIIRSGQILKQ